MKLHTTLAVFAVVCAVTLKCVAAIPTHLTCEYRENPVGVESENPRLSWWLPEGSTTQKAYRIVADGLWDSGWVESDQSVNIPYGGKPVDDLSRVTWRVSVKTDLGESGWSEDAHWTQGKRFSASKEIKRAVLAICGLGYYEASLDTKGGRFVAAVRRCDFRCRLQHDCCNRVWQSGVTFCL